MTNEPRTKIRVTHRFSASPERVFDAFLDPAKAGKFMFATPTGQMVRVEIDARVGGKFCFTDRRDGEDVAHTGAYLEIDRPRRLAFTLAVEKYSAEIDRVVIEIVPVGTGCELTLTHELQPSWAEQTREGWSKILGRLAEIIDAR